MRKKIATLVILCLMLTQWVGLAHAVADFDHNKHTVMNTTNATIGNFTPTTPADHLHVNKGCKECHNSCHSHCHSHFFVQDTIFISASVVKKIYHSMVISLSKT